MIKWYSIFGKRTTDVLLSMVLIILFSPLFVIIAFMLFFINHGKIFFVQHRSGTHGKVFRIIKFKTMSDALDEQHRLLPDVNRITTLGRFLRKYSIDELPQLVNVLRGNMSIVGPRPLPVDYDSLYSEPQRRRLLATPGITGYAQVNGRNSVTWDEKFDMDAWYVDNISFWLDFKIILKTIPVVMSKAGVNSSEMETMQTLAEWVNRK